jgi:4-hydroxy-tetrahydrodipicolinate synthase
MADPLFQGVGVALVTFFDDDGRLLTDDTAAHAADLVGRGVTAVVVSGTTGESWALDVDERLELVAAVHRAVDGRAPVIVGTGHLDDAAAHRLVGAAGTAGAAAALALSPSGGENLRSHYEALAATADGLPVLGYHNPTVAPPGIALEALSELPIVGLKDSSANVERLVAELAAFDRPLYVGSSAYLALAGPLGATGAILGLANTDPEGCIAAFAGDVEAQRELLPAHLETRVDFPAGLKRRLARIAGTPPHLRPRAYAAA